MTKNGRTKSTYKHDPVITEIVRNGMSLLGDLFRVTHTVPRTAVFMHVNDTFGQAMAKGIDAYMTHFTELPFKIVDTIAYDPAAKDLTVEQRQLVDIARSLSKGARFIILDEPTARLDAAAIERLFARVRTVPLWQHRNRGHLA